MRTRTAIVLVMTVLLLATAGTVEAGTLGQRMVSVQVGRVDLSLDGEFKELEQYLDDIYVYGVSLQLPLGRYFEILANASRTTITGKYQEDGFRATLDAPITAFSGGARVHFLPDATFNPFISAMYTQAKFELTLKAEGETFKADETEKSISVSAGLEVALGDKFSVIGAFTRTMPESKDREFDLQGKDDDRDAVSVGLNYWVTERVVIGAAFAQELEDDTRTIGLNLGFKF